MADMIRAVAIILAALTIAGAIAFVFRWQIAANASGVFVLDRWNGNVVECRQAILGRQMDCL